MPKLKLQVETLSVESFDSGATDDVIRGTVKGASYPATDHMTCEHYCNLTYGPNTCAVNCATTTTTEG